MKKIYTVSVGIPAHNEEGNIIQLLTSIYKQHMTSFRIKQIIVALDGCSDNTESLVKEFASTHKEVEMISDGERKGKAFRLNQIYKKALGDFLMSFDADVLPKNKKTIEYLVQTMIKNPRTNVVGARFIPMRQKSLMGKLSVISYESFEDAVLKLQNGNNIYALMGAAHLIRLTFGKKVIYPKGTISDQNYLYMRATQKNKFGFLLNKKAEVYMQTVSTFKDWRILGVRSTETDKKNLVKFFGKDVMKIYYMPRRIFIFSLIKYIVTHPLLTIGSIIMNIYIRKYPYSSSKPRNGMWQLTQSSKIGIQI
jgi:glycosyltransferase involved in cell wall biosynthesis